MQIFKNKPPLQSGLCKKRGEGRKSEYDICLMSSYETILLYSLRLRDSVPPTHGESLHE